MFSNILTNENIVLLRLAILLLFLVSCAQAPVIEESDHKGTIYKLHTFSLVGKLNDASTFAELKQKAVDHCAMSNEVFEFVNKQSNGITGQDLYYRCVESITAQTESVQKKK
jgi:hypothetical protein